MTPAQAIKTAKDYSKVRKEVRKVLLEAARAATAKWSAKEKRQNDTLLRKLSRYPSDLTEQRLVNVLEGKTGLYGLY